MPIANLVEHTIVPRMAMSFAGNAASGHKATEGRFLPLPLVQASSPESVWVSVALSIERYYSGSIADIHGMTAEDIEERVKYMAPRSRAAGKGDPLQLALQALGHLQSTPSGHPADFLTVQSELSEGRPVATRISWSNGLPHYVAIFGFRIRGGRREYMIADPLHGVLSVSDWSLTHSYLCDGVWTEFFLTR